LADCALFGNQSFFENLCFNLYYPLARMETASFFDEIRQKRYSEQQEITPEKEKI